MKKIIFLITLLLVITLTGCFGNYRDGYRKYNRNIGTYDIYVQKLEDSEECPNEEGHLYTLYAHDDNTFKYKGIRSGDGCYVPVLIDTGSGFSTVQSMLDSERITLEEVQSVVWTFKFVIEQEPDFVIDGIDFIEYFEEIGEYEVYTIDYGNVICHDMDTVKLFKFQEDEYDVLGVPTGNGCRSEYFVYVTEEPEETEGSDDDDSSDDSVQGVMMTVNDALVEGHITVTEILAAGFESSVYKVYLERDLYINEGSIYLINFTQRYNRNNPYILSEDDLDDVLRVLSTNRYRHTIDEDSEETFIRLNDEDNVEHRFPIYYETEESPSEFITAVLTLKDLGGNEHVYEIYPTGTRKVGDDIDVYTEYGIQTDIVDLVERISD